MSCEKCPVCGQKVEPTETVCKNCGATIIENLPSIDASEYTYVESRTIIVPDDDTEE